MILFKCVHGHVFSEDEMVREEYPEGEAVRHRYLCPDCGTEDFEQAHACSRCGFLFREDEMNFDLCEKYRFFMGNDWARMGLFSGARAGFFMV